ncbi:cellulose-binding protein [Actinophytocola sediminis]
MADGRELVPLRTGFDVVLRGYRRGPVRQYVQSVEEELRMLAADRDANAHHAESLTKEVEKLRAERAKLERKVDELSRAPIDATALPERLRRMLELAKEEAAEIIARAQAAAENCWATAEEAAGRLRARYEDSIAELDERRRTMETEHRTLLAQTRAEVADMTTEADRRRAELDDRAAKRRERVETDFDLAMSARRAEAMREIVEQKLAARAEADRLVAEARADATRRIDAATRRVDELHDLRGQVAARIRGAQEVLAAASPLLRPDAAEAEPPPRPRALPTPREHVAPTQAAS